MYRFTKLILFVVTLVSALTPFDAYSQDVNSPEEVMAGFCGNIASDPEMAAAYIANSIKFGSTKTGTEVMEAKLALQSSFEKFTNTFGEVLSCSYAHTASIGSEIKKLVYVVVYPLRPIVVQGHFMRIDEGWRMYSFQFIEEAEKFPYLVDH